MPIRLAINLRTALVALSLTLAMSTMTACGEDDSDDPIAANNDPTPDPMPDGEPTPNPDPQPDVMPDPEPEVAPGVSICGGFNPAVAPETPEDCATCVDDNCCDVATACGEDADCLALRECFAVCSLGDTDCVAACNTDISDETLALNGPLIQCRNSNCGTACQRITDWTCVGEMTPDPITEPGDVTLTITLNDFQTGDVLSGVDVKVCAADDANCETPIDTTESDSNGILTVTVDRGDNGFVGYLELSGNGAHPSISYFAAPVVEDRVLTFDVVKTSTLNFFAALVGTEINPDAAQIAVTTFDCSGIRARGVILSAEDATADTTIGYIKDSVPDGEATSTDGSGIGGIFNLPLADTTTTRIAATRADDGTEVTQEEVIIRPGFLTTISTEP